MFSKKWSSIIWENSSLLKKLFVITFFIIWIYFAYRVGNIIAILFFALFLNILFSPFLNFLNKYKIGDAIGITIIYLFLLWILFVMFFAIIPIFVKQISLLFFNINLYIWDLKTAYDLKWIDWLNIPNFLKSTLSHLDFNSILDTAKNNLSEIWTFVGNNLKNFLSNWAGVVFSITNAIFTFFMVFIFAFFIALERKQIKNFFYKILPNNISSLINKKEEKIIFTLSSWLKWQIILGISIFSITWLWLFIIWLFGIKLEWVFTLALIAGAMEFIPYVWPFIALLPALAIAAGLWYKAVLVILILYIIIQQIENNLLVPYVMSKTLSISPFAVLFAMTIWASLFGIIGIIIAVPVVSIISIFLEDYLKSKK